MAQKEAEQCCSNVAAPLQTVGPTMQLSNASATGEAPYRQGIRNDIWVCELVGLIIPKLKNIFYVIFSFRSPESVEMDEIMAAMVLTSLSCPVVQSPPQTDPGPGLSQLTSVVVVSSINLW